MIKLDDKHYYMQDNNFIRLQLKKLLGESSLPTYVYDNFTYIKISKDLLYWNPMFNFECLYVEPPTLIDIETLISISRNKKIKSLKYKINKNILK